jgi:hypothetical protein
LLGEADSAVSLPIEQADYWVARHGFFDGGSERFEHEFDEGCCIGTMVVFKYMKKDLECQLNFDCKIWGAVSAGGIFQFVGSLVSKLLCSG